MAQAGGTWWFQVYVMRDRELTTALVRRAAAAGAAALVLTADTPVVGRKRRSRGEGAVTPEEFLANTGPLADPRAAEQAPDVTFADIGWLASLGGGMPVLVKGVLRADDARACVAAGAAGVIVSNHGGRQLDRALPTALALAPVAAALRDGQTPTGRPAVLVDGGVRSGEDVLAAVASGAGRRVPRAAGAVGPGLRRRPRRAGPADRPDQGPRARDGAGRGGHAGRPARPGLSGRRAPGPRPLPGHTLTPARW